MFQVSLLSVVLYLWPFFRYTLQEFGVLFHFLLDILSPFLIFNLISIAVARYVNMSVEFVFDVLSCWDLFTFAAYFRILFPQETGQALRILLPDILFQHLNFVLNFPHLLSQFFSLLCVGVVNLTLYVTYLDNVWN